MNLYDTQNESDFHSGTGIWFPQRKKKRNKNVYVKQAKEDGLQAYKPENPLSYDTQ